MLQTVSPNSLAQADPRPPEAALIAQLIDQAALAPQARAAIVTEATALVSRIRASSRPGLMEVFLAEYGLSTEEGIALMCLAEALLRVPDARTIDRLIEDKIAPSDWGRHLGRSASSLVNASTWALLLTGHVLEDAEPGVTGHLRAALKRLGEPVIRTAVGRAMKEMGRAFVLGESIDAAMSRARWWETKGYAFSYDMLGEAARTEADARRYHEAYLSAIAAIARQAGPDIRTSPGISVKLSALHPRYETAQRARVLTELAPRLATLVAAARAANIMLTVDAEESDRLALSFEVIAKVLGDADLAGWTGFGIVVQAVGRRAGPAIEAAYDLATRLDRHITLRLVKGAYWDTEVKRAQVQGLDSFPVFTRKEATDAAYLAHARRLLQLTDRIYPQFATHNAHTVAAVLHMAREEGVPADAFEFQRLHGMGERLHELVMEAYGTRCRIYAPVGAHRDLLAYLVRRLLENGANSSFVNQIVDTAIPPEAVAACPLTRLEALGAGPDPRLRTGATLYDTRANSAGFDLGEPTDLAVIETARTPFRDTLFHAEPLLAGPATGVLNEDRFSPADRSPVGSVLWSGLEDIRTAARLATPWSASPETRKEILNRAADLYEAETGALFALLAREAGKTLADALSERREAVDFLRYYAAQADQPHAARGIFACVSPWNFPLAIFTGQIAAALATGNGVIAKPAEQTPLIAHYAVSLLHKAGVPKTALQLLPGDGAVGAALIGNPRIDGVAFTGGTDTAHSIRTTMARNLAPGAPLIAETGGLNAMIVDSTALPEQAVRDIVASAFQSAGQRCSALRCLYVQEDIADGLIAMLKGAMDELRLGNPWELATDIGPVIDAEAQAGIGAYVDEARAAGRVIKELAPAKTGTFIGPTLLRVGSIADLPREIFGPVLHVATFPAAAIDKVIDAINAKGYGLTFGLHSRIDDRVEQVVSRVHAGNLYVNRNQIGAVVGSQPFGGEGLSGTGPKAGGPHYLARFTANPAQVAEGLAAPAVAESGIRRALAEAAPQPVAPQPVAPQPVAQVTTLPGPTGESNRLSLIPRAPILCLGPTAEAVSAQAQAVRALGGTPLAAPGLPPEALSTLQGFSAALFWGDEVQARACAVALSQRPGPILPLITELPDIAHAMLERHTCIDTTASGGNAQLLAEVAGAA